MLRFEGELNGDCVPIPIETQLQCLVCSFSLLSHNKFKEEVRRICNFNTLGESLFKVTMRNAKEYIVQQLRWPLYTGLKTYLGKKSQAHDSQ